MFLLKTRAFQRSIVLFDQGKLSVSHLKAFVYGVGGRPLTPDETIQLIKRLEPFALRQDYIAVQLKYIIIYRLLVKTDKKPTGVLKGNRELEQLIWTVVERVNPKTSMIIYYWENILTKLKEINPERVIRILTEYIGNDDYSLDQTVTSMLAKISGEYPQIVMRYLGKVLLEKETSFRFSIRKYDFLIHSISSEVIIS